MSLGRVLVFCLLLAPFTEAKAEYEQVFTPNAAVPAEVKTYACRGLARSSKYVFVGTQEGVALRLRCLATKLEVTTSFSQVLIESKAKTFEVYTTSFRECADTLERLVKDPATVQFKVINQEKVEINHLKAR